MRVSPKDATHALLGVHGAEIGVVSWHNNEFDAWREARDINASGGRVKVVPVINGDLTAKHQEEKAELFAAMYSRLVP